MNPFLEKINIMVAGLAQRIDAPDNLLPTYGYTLDGAHPHVEADSNGEYAYVIVERGKELKREIAIDENDLLYKVFSDVSFSMAVAYEVKHRIKNEDARRQMFAKQEELLGILDPSWRERRSKEHETILRSYPFVD